MPTAILPRAFRPKSTKPVTHRYFPAIHGHGTLELGRGGNIERYVVAQIGSDPEGAPGRTFRLRKCEHPEEVYDCHVAELAELSNCDCQDFIYTAEEVKHYYCKHLLVLRDLVATGQIDAEDPDRPTTVFPTIAVRMVAAPRVETPIKVTLSCPICGEAAEARPVRGGRFSHVFHCSSCTERMEGV